MKTVLLVSNTDLSVYWFKRELVMELLRLGYRVGIVTPPGPKVEKFREMGAEHIPIRINRHGKNPVQEIKLLWDLTEIIRKHRPEIVYTFTIKPNLYGAAACRLLRIPIVCTVTGLGIGLEKPGLLRTMALTMYKAVFRKVDKVLFQNKENMEFLLSHGVKMKSWDVIHGSGVNLEAFPLTAYPQEEPVRFLFSSRILEEKGIEYYIHAAEYLSRKYPQTEFHVCGLIEDCYQGRLLQAAEDGIVIYHGMVENPVEYYKMCHCVVLPSFYLEGLNNTLLEAAAVGRPLVTTDHLGCRETVMDGVTGYMVPIKDQNALNTAMERIVLMSASEREKMGAAGRSLIATKMDRKKIIAKYIEELEKCAR